MMTETTETGRGRFSSFDIEEEEFDEALGLLDHAPIRSYAEELEEEKRANHAWKWWVVTLVLVMLWSSYLLESPNSNSSKSFSSVAYPQYQCPRQKGGEEENFPENVQNFEDEMDEAYGKISKSLEQNITEFLKDFRSETYDDWDQTYDKMKTAVHDWKYEHYVPYMKNGSSIFESACGIGLNLYMTLEIIQEAGIQDVKVYGNDFVEESVAVANDIYELVPPAGATKGEFCKGDSSDLSYIPSSSFDLVFCGYIR
jgi:hypothetical protein